MNIKYNVFKLKNGMKIVYIPRQNHPTTSICVIIRVGSRNETETLYGASHFLEHMCFKGTKNRPTSKFITGELDSVGAFFNAYTGKNVTCYMVKIDSDHLKKGIDILSDMLLNSKITAKDMKVEKRIVTEEINKSKDDPDDLISEFIMKMIYKNHPLGRSIGSDEKHIANYKRTEVLNYFKQHYTANNMVVSISSNLSLQKIKTLIGSSVFAKFKSNKKSIQHVPIPMNIQHEMRCQVKQKKHLEQTILTMGFPTCNMYHTDRYVLDLIRILLAGNMSSRLFKSLREKYGITYNVAIDTSYYMDNGHFLIHTNLTKDCLLYKCPKTKTPGGLPIIIDNLIKLKINNISNKELDRVKGFFKGQILLEKESSISVTDYFGKQILFNYKPINDFNYILKKISKITVSDIKTICQKYFDFSKCNIVVFGNYKANEIKKFVKTHCNNC